MTLSRLLLIFPAYLLGMLLARVWESYTVISCYRYMFGLNDVQNAGMQLAYVEEEYGPQALGKSVVEQWLADSLPANHPSWRLLVERLGMQMDPWGNPYKCVENVARDDGTHVAMGVYSTGRDGVSQTQGNDPDDLNSWDGQTGAYYRAEISDYERKQSVIQGLYVVPFVYLALLGIGALFKRSAVFWCTKVMTCGIQQNPNRAS